jgi:hypothetical protein
MTMQTGTSAAAPGVVIGASRETLRRAWSKERAEARQARVEGDVTAEWRHLERAHILSQPMAGPHVRTHLDMFAYGIRHRNGREVLGQLVRILVAAPGSWTGKYPVGNTGAASVSALVPMPVPDDLRAILAGRAPIDDPR